MIDKEYAIQTLRTMEYDFDSERVALNMAIKALENERPKGKWEITQGGDYLCNNCYTVSEREYKFCPNCGADMRESEVEDEN